jgi:transglutaminase-like putative cysteine protease
MLPAFSFVYEAKSKTVEYSDGKKRDVLRGDKDMKKSLIILFLLRLFFYFSVIALILIHPGIKVTFDRIGVIQWFLIIPIMAVLAFLSEKKIQRRTRAMLSFSFLFLFSVTAGGFNLNALAPFAAGIISFTFTFLLFNRKPLFSGLAKITVLEPFFLAWVCLRLLSLSRSGEDIAGQSIALTQFMLVWTAVVFLFHNVIIYLCLYPNSRLKVWKEGLVFSLAAGAVLIVTLFVLPKDFVRNAVITNLLSEKIPQKISNSEQGIPQRGGSKKRQPKSEGGKLRGMSEHDWPGRGNDGSEQQRQYMVMVVASEKEPVYMGNSFRGQLDPVKGFILSQNEPLNDLANQRFFVTWFSNDQEHDIGRERQEVFSLSTLRQKYLPYRPIVIDPVILSDDTGPLRYIHQVVSNTHSGDPLMLVREQSRPLTAFEKSALAAYLEITLEDEDKIFFEEHLRNALLTWRQDRTEIIKSSPYLNFIFSNSAENDQKTPDENKNELFETIIALLTSFSSYQYNLDPDDDSSIEALKYFITDSKEGDCVEFSNSLALLGRLAGIPSRVVTGFLASEDLQTEAHLRGLVSLRNRLPVLQKFPFENLYMVTNIHSHSWTQFFIPDYGWLDFDATSFSIPPQGMGDFNNWDVIIPLFDEQQTFSNVKKFPWRAVGKALVNMVIFALICAYALRYGRELILYINSNRTHYDIRSRTRSLYLLLLARLAADGQPIKPASKTAAEYSQLFRGKEESSCFKPFAEIYSELRWRQFEDLAEMESRFQQLKKEYREILTATRRKGIHRLFIRIISLRGLAYL